MGGFAGELDQVRGLTALGFVLGRACLEYVADEGGGNLDSALFWDVG